MKVEMQYYEPEHVKDRGAYRVRIEGKDGQVIEIVEQLGGGFSIIGAYGKQLTISPVNQDTIILRVKP